MKKIAIMSFYESNSRYIHQLSKQIKEVTGRDTVQLCMYASSTNYCIKNSLEYIDLPGNVRKYKSEKNITIPRHFYEFHVSLFPELEKYFLDISRKYWDFYENYFPWEDFHSVVFIGDKRLYSSIGGYFAKLKEVQVFYFEPGPYGTMIFDPKGVNCNMSITTASLDMMRNNVNEDEIEYLYNKCITSVSEKKFYEKNIGSYFRKIKDVLQSVPPSIFRKVCAVELYTGEGFWESIPYLLGRLPFKKNSKANKIDIEKQGKYIFVALQVPNDVQIISNCKLFSSIDDMLTSVIKSLPEGYDLIVREHPMNKGRYNKSLYKLINENVNVHIDNNTPIDHLIDNSSLVIVINSTVGLEAAVRGAAVLTLGDIYYPQIVNNLTSRESLKTEIVKAIDNKATQEEVKLYIAYLFKNYMVKDNYKNSNYYDLNNAVEKICCR
ncbi:TPA: hypothetical protein OTY97_001328 [Citrobacter koseri]|uniref:Capsule polysaccharide biosynthesis protein n=3 Tax=Citrobacter koseri TaxID=545 RepID=A8AEI5_CITK8|nr:MULTISPECIES: hypothetical protein [Citrobacter]ABV11898.1 hypothetical protein CKO_00746 [Citrobacter koseri ATCC BAA-895]AYY74923.1 hypothetical protein EGX86_14120 [Citrobacter koseri]EJD6488963.1 hypothetical protein [Citrobacter koseri]EKV5611017.1 hypothetical protein [Citrobacter koseri]EKW1004001.1 hypothetical protein [Citrobacter koseri]